MSASTLQMNHPATMEGPLSTYNQGDNCLSMGMSVWLHLSFPLYIKLLALKKQFIIGSLNKTDHKRLLTGCIILACLYKFQMNLMNDTYSY